MRVAVLVLVLLLSNVPIQVEATSGRAMKTGIIVGLVIISVIVVVGIILFRRSKKPDVSNEIMPLERPLEAPSMLDWD